MMLLFHMNQKYVEVFWSNSHQYLNRLVMTNKSKLNFIDDDSEQSAASAIDIHREKKRFLEIHYTLGGLLLYKKQYDTIKSIFNYTQSDPPSYVLLPSSMDEIFKKLIYYLEGDFELDKSWSRIGGLGQRFRFEGINTIETEKTSTHWVCMFMALLFVRQYNLISYYVNDNYEELPNLPLDKNKLYLYSRNLDYFERCVTKIIDDVVLLKTLNYSIDNDNINDFFERLRNHIDKTSDSVHEKAELDPEQVAKFYIGTLSQVNIGFDYYDGLFQPEQEVDFSEEPLRLGFDQVKETTEKTAFTSGGRGHLNFDTIYGEMYVSQVIRPAISESFIVKRTHSYIIERADVLNALNKLGADDGYTILTMNTEWDINEELKEAKYQLVLTYPMENIKNAIFVVKNNDKPALLSLKEKNSEANGMDLIDEKLGLYASIIDINKESDKGRWKHIDKKNTKVEMSIALHTQILWKKDAKVIQLNVNSRTTDNGVAQDISDIDKM